MATLAGSTIASTYTYLLKMDATSGITSSLVAVQDGDATDSALSISTTSASIGHTVTTAASTPKALFVDANTSGVAAQDATGMHIDFDRTVAGSGTAAHNDIGINLDVNSASLGTSTVIGMDIDVVGATGGTHKAIGLTVDVGSSDTNYAALFNGGNVGIGTASPGYALDILNSTTPQLNISNTASNDTAKFSQITTSHYHNSEEPMTMIEGRSDGSQNYVRLGGGRSEGNSMTILEGYFGSNDATTSGTKKFSFDESNGYFLQNIGIGETTPTAMLHVKRLSGSGGALKLEGNHDQVGMPSVSFINNSGTTGTLAWSNTGATDAFTFTGGNVGIGDTDPSEAKLSITGVAAGDYGIKIDQDQNVTALLIDAENTDSDAVSVTVGVATTGAGLGIYSTGTALATTTGGGLVQIEHTGDSDSNANNLMFILNNDTGSANTNCLWLRQNASAFGLQVFGGSAMNSQLIRCSSINASFGTAMSHFECSTASGTGWNFLSGDSSYGGSADREFTIRGDGQVAGDLAYNVGADYAEYFESKDGNAIPVGTTVKLDGNKVVACSEGDTPIGVIRPYGVSSAVGNTAWNRWHDKHLRDDYGAHIMEEHTITDWTDEEGEGHSYHSDKIPSDLTAPDDAVVKSVDEDGNKFNRRKLNPDYDDSIEYVSREFRDEWNIVGLLGQVSITKGQPLSDSWIKMKDISDTVEMYFVK